MAEIKTSWLHPATSEQDTMSTFSDISQSTVGSRVEDPDLASAASPPHSPRDLAAHAKTTFDLINKKEGKARRMRSAPPLPLAKVSMLIPSANPTLTHNADDHMQSPLIPPSAGTTSSGEAASPTAAPRSTADGQQRARGHRGSDDGGVPRHDAMLSPLMPPSMEHTSSRKGASATGLPHGTAGGQAGVRSQGRALSASELLANSGLIRRHTSLAEAVAEVEEEESAEGRRKVRGRMVAVVVRSGRKTAACGAITLAMDALLLCTHIGLRDCSA